MLSLDKPTGGCYNGEKGGAAMDIPHRKTDEPSKLVTQLRLYRALYENWRGRENYRDIAGEGEEDKDPGVPLADLERFGELSQRTWNRYLRELEVCHAVGSARFHRGGRYCLSQPGDLRADYDQLTTPHLRRLYRTVRLMKQWLDGEQRGPEELGNEYSVKVFFQSLDDAEGWFFGSMDELLSDRSKQRDMKDVWTALRYH
jgi:hypothetical protein